MTEHVEDYEIDDETAQEYYTQYMNSPPEYDHHLHMFSGELHAQFWTAMFTKHLQLSGHDQYVSWTASPAALAAGISMFREVFCINFLCLFLSV